MSATGAATYRQQAPPQLSGTDADYDYRAANAAGAPTPTSASAQGWNQVQAYNTNNKQGDQAADGEEALLDLVQLEELHQEAERMKALGNKHMAAQGRVWFKYADNSVVGGGAVFSSLLFFFVNFLAQSLRVPTMLIRQPCNYRR